MKKTFAIIATLLIALAVMVSCEPEAHVCTLEKVSASDPTCEAAGVKEHYFCTECGKLYADAEGTQVISEEATVVSALGHDYGTANNAWLRVGGKDVYGKACTRTGCTHVEEAVAAIGSQGPAGGVIFYVAGDSSNGWKYIEAASTELRSTSTDPLALAIGSGTTIKGVFGGSTEIGTIKDIGAGKTNTDAIYAAVCNNGANSMDGSNYYAAYLVKNLSVTVGGVTYADWYIPSLDEISAYYDNIAGTEGAVMPKFEASATKSWMTSTEKQGNAATYLSAWAVKVSPSAAASAQKAKNVALPILPIRYI